MGDFYVNIQNNSCDRKKLQEYMVTTKKYTQIITKYTTDYKSLIYTNISQQAIVLTGILVITNQYSLNLNKYITCVCVCGGEGEGCWNY